MKKTGIAVAVVVAIGLVGTAGAWYTGTKMEAVLRDAVAQSNGQIEKVLPGSAVRLEMTDFQRGVFSSSARYELGLSLRDPGRVPKRKARSRSSCWIECSMAPFPCRVSRS
jgi:uncharacterized protein YdgA (DUF945 family)